MIKILLIFLSKTVFQVFKWVVKYFVQNEVKNTQITMNRPETFSTSYIHFKRKKRGNKTDSKALISHCNEK